MGISEARSLCRKQRSAYADRRTAGCIGRVPGHRPLANGHQARHLKKKFGGGIPSTVLHLPLVSLGREWEAEVPGS